MAEAAASSAVLTASKKEDKTSWESDIEGDVDEIRSRMRKEKLDLDNLFIRMQGVEAKQKEMSVQQREIEVNMREMKVTMREMELKLAKPMAVVSPRRKRSRSRSRSKPPPSPVCAASQPLEEGGHCTAEKEIVMQTELADPPGPEVIEFQLEEEVYEMVEDGEEELSKLYARDWSTVKQHEEKEDEVSERARFLEAVVGPVLPMTRAGGDGGLPGVGSECQSLQGIGCAARELRPVAGFADTPKVLCPMMVGLLVRKSGKGDESEEDSSTEVEPGASDAKAELAFGGSAKGPAEEAVFDDGESDQQSDSPSDSNMRAKFEALFAEQAKQVEKIAQFDESLAESLRMSLDEQAHRAALFFQH